MNSSSRAARPKARRAGSHAAGLMSLVLVATTLGLPAAEAWAARVYVPVVRPGVPGSPNVRPLVPGRFYYQPGGATAAPAAGIFKVEAIDDISQTLTLQDDQGRSAVVAVDRGVYDIDSLNVGDEVQVDFFLIDESTPTLKAAFIWPVRGSDE